MISESGSSSAPASIASVSVGQQQVNISVGKEVDVNGENGYDEGNGKQSSSHEDRDLQEWYKTFSYFELLKGHQNSKHLFAPNPFFSSWQQKSCIYSGFPICLNLIVSILSGL